VLLLMLLSSLGVLGWVYNRLEWSWWLCSFFASLLSPELSRLLVVHCRSITSRCTSNKTAHGTWVLLYLGLSSKCECLSQYHTSSCQMRKVARLLLPAALFLFLTIMSLCCALGCCRRRWR
jgi:hypothetical protein